MLTQVCPLSMVRPALENPKTVGRFFLGVMALALAVALTASVLFQSFLPLLWMLAIAAGLLLLSLAITVLFAPLLWLLSRLSGRNHDRGASAREESRRDRG
jgi:hypothetical protein